MSSLVIALIFLGCMLAGISFGIFLRSVLPDHHTRDETKDITKTAAGMLATLIALVIGLLVSSAKSAFDSTSASITQGGAKIITLDHVLARYGPDAKGVREQLRHAVTSGVERIWPANGSHHADMAGAEVAPGMEDIYDKIRELAPENDSQNYLKTQALQLSADLMQSRWLLIEQSQNELPDAFLFVLAFWLAVLFTSFGLSSPRTLTAIFALTICAMSMSGAIYLILELNHPLEGTIKVSNAPLRKALSVIGK